MEKSNCGSGIVEKRKWDSGTRIVEGLWKWDVESGKVESGISLYISSHENLESIDPTQNNINFFKQLP